MYQCLLACGSTDPQGHGCYASRVTEAQRRGDASGEPHQLSREDGPGQQRGTPDEGIIDLLGLLAYAELDAYFRLTEDAALAPSLADKAALAGMATAEFGHFRLLCDQLSALGAQPEQAMLPFAPALDAFHARTAPADWLEGLVKAYVGDGIAADFYRAVAELVNPQTRDLVLRVLADTGHAEFVIARVRAAIATDPHLAGRLALWARRLVGEALAQAYRVVADRRSLAGLLAGARTPATGGTEAAPAAPRRRPTLHPVSSVTSGASWPISPTRTPRGCRHSAWPAYRGPLARPGDQGQWYQAQCGRAQAARPGPARPGPVRPWHASVAGETDPALLDVSQLDVGDLAGRHQEFAALVVGQHEQPAVLGGHRLGQGLLQFPGRDVGLHDEFTRDGLDPDLDFHGAPELGLLGGQRRRAVAGEGQMVRGQPLMPRQASRAMSCSAASLGMARSVPSQYVALIWAIPTRPMPSR